MKQRPAILLEQEDEDLEIGTLETLPSAITFCLENHKVVQDPKWYAQETTIKIGEIAFAKNAP